LTKIFVVFLVVFSLLLSAATITFVNAVANHRDAASKAELALGIERAKAARLESTMSSAQAAARQQIGQLEGQVQSVQQALTAEGEKVRDRDAQLAQAASDKASLQTELTGLRQALTASQEAQKNLTTQAESARNRAQDLFVKNQELNRTNSDVTNRLAVTERERRNLAEQLTEVQKQLDNAHASLKQYGVNPNTVAAVAPSINGVIKSRQVIAGVPYAVISVGSNSDVQTGMEFNIVDRGTGAFLGVLTVTAVEPNEAIGRLSGKRVEEVQPGAGKQYEVRTQLQ
jgi:hypothetical protein